MALNQIEINGEVYDYQFTEDGEDFCFTFPSNLEKASSYKHNLIYIDNQPYEFDTIDFVIIEPVTRYIIGEYIGNDEDYNKQSFNSNEFKWYE